MRPWLAIPAVLLAPLSAGADDRLFEAEVRPVLVNACSRCHGAKRASGGLRVDTRAALLKGGDSGPALVPGDADNSLLVRAIRHAKGIEPMPPAKPLEKRQVEALAAWVRDGAKWPDAVVLKAEKHWAFEPIGRPLPPPGAAASPVDAFLATAAPPADRRTLLRRVTFGLTGLPPTPEEVEAFQSDKRPDAYERVVERLLASPAYGERWGRHWLDVARYADSAGENSDHPLPHAWRYRNWVIDALNADKPYDAFLREQIAGDLLPGRYDAAVIATGYLAIARRFGHEIDKEIHLTIEDTLDTLGKSVLGLTLGCARCHAHKYDPISAEDYYALYGILASTKLSFPGCEPEPKPRDLVPLSDKSVAFAALERPGKDAPVHLRGDPEKPGKVVPRRWLTLLGGQPVKDPKGSGRLDLAGWLTAPDNPLTPRVLANRVWHHHFGRGIVATPNDFGTRGARPTHPELLDWLARDVVDHGWSLKHLHRRLVLSDAYRRADFERRRLSAEEIRDSLLVAGGALDRSRGGPHPFPPEKGWNFTQHNPYDTYHETDRRSVYAMSLRNRRHPFLGLFDGADPNASTPERGATTVPTQALYFLNDPFFHRQAAGLAGRAPTVRAAFRAVLQRPPTPREEENARRFLAAYAAAGETPARAWSAYCRVLLASNEFLYLD